MTVADGIPDVGNDTSTGFVRGGYEGCEAEVHRTAGQIALIGPEPDVSKSEAHFARALTIARDQKARSWELRTATSIARLWREQGKMQQAHDLLASDLRLVYRRFRHARFEAGEDASRRAARLMNKSKAGFETLPITMPQSRIASARWWAPGGRGGRLRTQLQPRGVGCPS
jgi:hypothetical protein